MEPRLDLFGVARAPVMTLDGAGPPVREVVALAGRLAPFPAATNHYPGLRRMLSAADGAAFDYVTDLLEAAAPYLAGAFDLDGFQLIEAGFSLVTALPEALTPVQRAPHFDTVDADVFAVLHYLSDTDGTAFFRHRATGLEAVAPETVDRFVAAVRREPAPAGYIRDSDAHYERIGAVRGEPGRLVAYPGRLLHSGLIPADFAPSADPRRGRLTCNIFIRGR